MSENSYAFEYRGGEIAINIEATSEGEARVEFAKVIDRKAPRFDPLCGVNGNVFLYSTRPEFWELVDVEPVMEHDPSHDGMSIDELVDHMSSDPGHQEELWGDFE